MIVTCMWGVSDSLGPRVGRRRGQRIGGRPGCFPTLLRRLPRLNTGGTERRPCLGYDQPASQALPARAQLMRNWIRRQPPVGLNGLKGGTVLPSLRSPNPFPL
jgi:hypothetical protein